MSRKLERREKRWEIQIKAINNRQQQQQHSLQNDENVHNHILSSLERQRRRKELLVSFAALITVHSTKSAFVCCLTHSMIIVMIWRENIAASLENIFLYQNVCNELNESRMIAIYVYLRNKNHSKKKLVDPALLSIARIMFTFATYQFHVHTTSTGEQNCNSHRNTFYCLIKFHATLCYCFREPARCRFENFIQK